jgi:hypothetical protein
LPPVSIIGLSSNAGSLHCAMDGAVVGRSG